MMPFEEAARRLAVLARPLKTETVRLEAASGRVLANPVVARISSPATAVSAMDGYAVRDADLQDGPVRLRVLGESFAGAAYRDSISPGGCVRVFTGAPAPEGANRVIIQEEVLRDGDHAIVAELPPGRRHLRKAASDFSLGDVLVEAGAVLNPQRLVAAAAADLSHVDVVSRPKVTILATGDELRAPGQTMAARGSIPDSVSLGVAAMAQGWGAEVCGVRRLRDELLGLERAAGEAVACSDLVIVTGGASVGARDFAKVMFEPLGLDLVFSKVAIKPGKPVWFGQASGKLVLGLPGNPTAALLTARLFLAPLICGLTGRGAGAAWSWRRAPLAAVLEGCGERETFYRAHSVGDAVAPLIDQDSSAQKALAASDVIIRRQPVEGKVEVGEAVSVLDF